MKLKKNPKEDLNLKRGLYFVIGLLFLLALIYIALEWKTISDNDGYDTSEFPTQEVRNKDSTVVLETNALLIQSNKSKSSQINKSEIIEIDSCGLGLGKEILDFHLVQEPPIFAGCENEKDKRGCFNKMMQKHFVKNFIYPETTENIRPYFKILIYFIIRKDGSISEIMTKAPSKSLEFTARRTIEKLPQMIPAKHNRLVTCIAFTFPISMHIQY